VPDRAYSRATLGVYELARVELLRDLYVWAYERSAQEYLAIKQDLAEPDPARLAYREVIRQIVREAVVRTDETPIAVIDRNVAQLVQARDRETVRALIVDELRRLHEGTLSRYRLRPAEFLSWKRRQDAGSI
jgi:hypothetical protein